MRLETEAPVSDLEKSIEAILMLNGYANSEIQFRQEERYLRIGYWEPLSEKALAQLESFIDSKVDWYDDECGYLCFYRLKK
jgi:hypothetical protein